MPLVTSKEMLSKAQKGGYAVGAFNAENMEMVKAIIQAAEELKAPVMIQTTPSTVKYGTVDTYAAIVAAEAKKASVPVCLHLDHGSSFELAMQAIHAGYTSVMIDGSKLDFEANIAETKRVADVAKALDIPCEAELGKVGGKEDDLDVVLLHCTDGIAVADYIAKSGYPAIVGPSMGCASKNEVWAKSFETAGVLSRAGVKVCLTADHDVTPLYYLPTYAEMAARYGMDQVEALKAVTLNPAQVLRIDDRKGSLQVGKDADLVLWNAHPFDVTARARHVFIEGEPIC